jgi:hypothetical protein
MAEADSGTYVSGTLNVFKSPNRECMIYHILSRLFSIEGQGWGDAVSLNQTLKTRK